MSRQRGRCFEESKTCHNLQGARSASPRAGRHLQSSPSQQERPAAPRGKCCESLGEWLPGQPGNAAWERPHTDTGKISLHSHPLRPANHTLSSGPNCGGTDELCADPPTPPPSNESIHPYLRLPYPTPGGMLWLGRGRKN